MCRREELGVDLKAAGIVKNNKNSEIRFKHDFRDLDKTEDYVGISSQKCENLASTASNGSRFLRSPSTNMYACCRIYAFWV